MKTEKKTFAPKKAKFDLYTRYGYSHLGLIPNEPGRKQYIPTLTLFSVRASQLFKVAHNTNNETQAKHAWALLEATEMKMNNCQMELQKANDIAQKLLEQDKNVDHRYFADELKTTYEIICNSKITWKAVRLLILYDNTVLKYLRLWDTGAMEKKDSLKHINYCSRQLRRLFLDFSVEVKKLLPQKSDETKEEVEESAAART